MLGSGGDTDIKDRLVVTVREAEGGVGPASSAETCTVRHHMEKA